MSLPGFGFSGKPTERGYSPERMAGIIAKLMARLGYTRYGVQGGDWGGIISRFVALTTRHVAACTSTSAWPARRPAPPIRTRACRRPR